MYNFYQSDIRKTINKSVYHKPVWDVSLFDKSYQYILWEKQKYWISMNWIQILGVENMQWHTYQEWKNELIPLVKKHNPIFIQIWCVDILSSYTRDELKEDAVLERARDIHNKSKKEILAAWFSAAGKENLPPSTYVIDLEDTIAWEKKFSGQHNSKIKKAGKHWIVVWVAQHNDDDAFYALLKKTAKEKWFWTISHSSYYNLISYFEKENTGNLYVAKIGNELIAAAVYVKDYVNKVAVYLYWWTDRKYSNWWASHLLHKEIYRILQKEGFEKIDLLWWGPTGFPKHKLSTVSVFKEWFWGTKFDYIWSFDIVYRSILYRIRKFIRLFHR